MLELIGDEPVRPAQERLGRSIELFAEPVRRFLANRPHPVLELERAGLAEPFDLAVGRALELDHLTTLELGECDLDPRSGFALGALDLLGHGVLVLAQALRCVLDRPTTVVGLDLQLLERLHEGVSGRPLELLAEPDRSRTLLVDDASELSGFRVDPCLDVGDPLPLMLLEHRDLSVEGTLRALQIRLPRTQAFLDPAFDRGDHLCEPLRELSLPDGELAPALVGQAALFDDVGGQRVGVRSRDRDPEQLRLSRSFFVSSGADGLACLRNELVDRRGMRSRVPERSPEDGGEDEGCEQRTREDPSDHRHGVMLETGPERAP